MKLIRKTNEAEMILEFLKGELNSKRFNEDLNNAINELGLDSSIILNGLDKFIDSGINYIEQDNNNFIVFCQIVLCDYMCFVLKYI